MSSKISSVVVSVYHHEILGKIAARRGIVTPFSAILLVLFCVLAFHIWTFVRTKKDFWDVVNRPGLGKRPPTLPHALPGLGHALSFSWDAPGFVSTIK